MTTAKLEAIKTRIREYIKAAQLDKTPVQKAFAECYPDAVQEGEFHQAWQVVMNERSAPKPVVAVAPVPVVEKPPEVTTAASLLVNDADSAPKSPTPGVATTAKKKGA